MYLLNEVLFFYVFLTFIIYFYTKVNIFAILILIWWGFWNFLATLSLTGLFIPSKLTQNVYFIFFSCFSLGIILVEFIKHKKFFKVKSLFLNKKNSIMKVENFLSKLIIFFILPLLIYFSIRAIYIMNFEIIYIGEYRRDVFGLITGTSKLFHNSIFISFFYSEVIYPIIFLSLFWSLSIFLIFKRKELLILSFILIILDSIMMAGRFGYHYIAMSFVIIFIYRVNKKGIFKILISHYYLFLIGFLLLILTFKIGEFRGNLGISTFINTFIIDYHTESFSILDSEIKNMNSIIHHTTYGLSLFAGIEKYFVRIFNFLGFDFISQANQIGAYLHSYRIVGETNLGDPIYYNAFGSIFFSIYRDGGYLYSAIIGFIYGLLIRIYSQSIMSFNVYHLSILIALLYIGIYGIFQPVTSGAMLPAIFLIPISYYFFSFFKNKNHD
jgi:oligosaccharide repeat unit polymerase